MKEFDSLSFKKPTRITTAYKKSHSRVKLNLPNAKSKMTAVAPFVFILLSLLLLTVAIHQSLPFQFLLLSRSLLNQSFLIGFQNSAELRPTGGFWGSFALLDIGTSSSHPQLNFDTNPYKLDNKLKSESGVNLPEPMQQMWPDAKQSFVNANWSADFPEAAQTLEWYIGQGWGDKRISGVVAVSSLSMIDLLKLTGPVQVDETEINSANFTRIMSERIDHDYWQNEENKTINEPKTIIKNLFLEISKKVEAVPKIKIAGFFYKQLASGKILVYFNDPVKQRLISTLRFTGEILPYKRDYLLINNANISGGKTSLNVSQRIAYEVSCNDEQTTSQLAITRRHEDLWPHQINTNYTRVYVPLGSTLKSCKLGVDDITDKVTVTQESGHSVFGFWFSTKNGQIKTAYLEYQLPTMTSSTPYQLLWQFQPGTLSDLVNLKINDKMVFDGTVSERFRLFKSF